MRNWAIGLCWLAATFAYGEGGYLEVLPEGQSACYKLDRDSKRTTGLAKDGKAQVVVGFPVADENNEVFYNIDFWAALQIVLFGWDKADFAVNVPEAFFTPEFIEALKISPDHTYHTDDFSVQWRGAYNVVAKDGVSYPNSQLLYFYNVNTSRAVSKPATREGGGNAIDNLKIHAYIHESVPGVGAARLDLTGIRRGVNISAGFDYTTDQRHCLATSN